MVQDFENQTLAELLLNLQQNYSEFIDAPQLAFAPESKRVKEGIMLTITICGLRLAIPGDTLEAKKANLIRSLDERNIRELKAAMQ